MPAGQIGRLSLTAWDSKIIRNSPLLAVGWLPNLSIFSRLSVCFGLAETSDPVRYQVFPWTVRNVCNSSRWAILKLKGVNDASRAVSCQGIGFLIRRAYHSVLWLAVFLSAVSFPVFSAAEERTLEQIADAVVELVAAIESEFDCIIKIVDIDEIPASRQTNARYFATFDAAGTGCNEASEELLERGKAEEFIFFRKDYAYRPDKRTQSPILDLIYEIDPPESHQ